MLYIAVMPELGGPRGALPPAPQFLADQSTLFQPGGHILPTLCYWHLQICLTSGNIAMQIVNHDFYFLNSEVCTDVYITYLFVLNPNMHFFLILVKKVILTFFSIFSFLKHVV